VAAESKEHSAHHAQKRREILDAAAEVFFLRGYDAGTTKEIATRVGLSQPSIYHYVGSKQRLLEEIVAEVHRELRQVLEIADSRSSDPREQLEATIMAMTDLVVRKQHMFGMFWQEVRRLPPDLLKQVEKDQRALVRRIERFVSALQETGELPAGCPPSVLTFGIMGAIAWTYQWHRKGPLSADDIGRAFVGLFNVGAPELISPR
jgi:AcrR family transcriptional regulator